MDEAGKKRLWQDYYRLKSPELREKLIIEYAPLVKLVAGRLSMYLGYNVEYDDLVGYGVFGLIDAIDKFDEGCKIRDICKLAYTWCYLRSNPENGLDSKDHTSAAKKDRDGYERD